MLLAFWSRISVTDHNFPLPNLHSSLMHPRALSGTDQRKNKGFACTDDFWGQEHFIKMHRPNRGRHEWHTCPAMCLGTALPRALLAQDLLPPAPAPLLSHWQPGGMRAGKEGGFSQQVSDGSDIQCSVSCASSYTSTDRYIKEEQTICYLIKTTI